MTEASLSSQVLGLFARPQNLGRLPEANGRGQSGDLQTGSTQIEIAVLIAADQVATARFRAFGCSTAIAAASMATILITGQAAVQAGALTAEAITAALGGVPPERAYAPQMAAEAVQRAVANWAEHAQGDG